MPVAGTPDHRRRIERDRIQAKRKSRAYRERERVMVRDRMATLRRKRLAAGRCPECGARRGAAAKRCKPCLAIIRQVQAAKRQAKRSAAA